MRRIATKQGYTKTVKHAKKRINCILVRKSESRNFDRTIKEKMVYEVKTSLCWIQKIRSSQEMATKINGDIHKDLRE